MSYSCITEQPACVRVRDRVPRGGRAPRGGRVPRGFRSSILNLCFISTKYRTKSGPESGTAHAQKSPQTLKVIILGVATSVGSRCTAVVCVFCVFLQVAVHMHIRIHTRSPREGHPALPRDNQRAHRASPTRRAPASGPAALCCATHIEPCMYIEPTEVDACAPHNTAAALRLPQTARSARPQPMVRLRRARRSPHPDLPWHT